MNLSEYDNKIVQWSGLYIGQQDRVDELNSRIMERDVPDRPLAPNFSPRSVPTKYSLYPILDNRMPASVPIDPNYGYSLEKNFTPPLLGRGPVSGFINHVETESQLRNQHFALQRGAGQNVYIPSSDSDLYKVQVEYRPSEQLFPRLFERPVFDQSVHINIATNSAIGRETFNNNTRTQLRTF